MIKQELNYCDTCIQMTNHGCLKCHMDTSKINRVEVIDHTKLLEEGGGRAYVFWEEGVNVTVDLQDSYRTLKIFITKELANQ